MTDYIGWPGAEIGLKLMLVLDKIRIQLDWNVFCVVFYYSAPTQAMHKLKVNLKTG